MPCFHFNAWLHKQLYRGRESPDSILFCDLDGTLLKDGKAAGDFVHYWKTYEKENNAILVYNTGRPIEFVVQKVREGDLYPVEFTICSQGLNVYCNEELWQPWVARMRSLNYTIKLVDFIEDQLRNMDVKPCKLSVNRHDFCLRWWVYGGESLSQCVDIYLLVCKSVVTTPACSLLMWTAAEINERFSDNDVWKEWGIGCDLHTAQDQGSKAPAAQFLVDWFNQKSNGLSSENIIWAGDAMNDSGMVKTGWKGIVVGNSDKDLQVCARKENVCGGRTYVSALSTAQGVIEGLQWWSAQSFGFKNRR